MSHFTKMKTKIRDLSSLKRACERLNLNLEVGQGLEVRGFSGRPKIDGAVIKLDRYDVGFERKQDGSYEIVTDLWGLETKEKIKSPTEWLNRITQMYNVEYMKKQALLKGYSVTESVQQDGSIMLKVMV